MIQQSKRKLILLVEDNEKIMHGNQRLFGLAGFETMAALTLAEARTSIATRKPDAVVLDIMLPDGSPPARTMLAGFARPILTGWEQIGGRLNAEGLLEMTLLYMTDDSDIPVTVNQEEPFRVAFACEAEPNDWLTLESGNIDVTTITSDRVEMKYILHLTVDGCRREDAKIVSDVKNQEAAIPTGGISLYFAQPGDTLWDIAKRYRVPRQQLLGLNPTLADGEVQQGTGVVVWRRDAES